MWRNDKFIVRLCFILLALIFWRGFYSFHLAYQEQFQLFMFTSDYWINKCMYPGGICEYISEFLTQFYYSQWLGSIILVGVLVLVQWLTSRLIKGTGNGTDWYYLSYLPAIAVWCFLCDENNMLAAVVSLLVVMVVAKGSLCIRNVYLRWGYILILTPIVYWVAGGLHWLFVCLAVIYELLLWKSEKLLYRLSVCIFFCAWLFCILTSHLKRFNTHFSSDDRYRLLSLPYRGTLDRDHSLCIALSDCYCLVLCSNIRC